MKSRATSRFEIVFKINTQHAKWTAKRVRRGLFGQSIVDFTTASWSSIQLKESSINTASQEHEVQPKKAPRLLRSFAKARIVPDGNGSPVPGMSFYDDVDMEVEHVGIEDFVKQMLCLLQLLKEHNFFELSP